MVFCRTTSKFHCKRSLLVGAFASYADFTKLAMSAAINYAPQLKGAAMSDDKPYGYAFW
ncbi:hypothetical protein IQ276_005205 [Desmonostoc muscorum LEGE 12446]|uniref:Uncharacterized protein n=1 Tax=Desmonostoc muscorum LEGE 12446 TaxID=1828758 RepID=A0A8J7ABX8_DESMC|nr:hypothetical protein [Desmonostoc muscorum]MCF2145867.1 hypothetical protein [Desmonostoc muscorum LEGE 12446]